MRKSIFFRLLLPVFLFCNVACITKTEGDSSPPFDDLSSSFSSASSEPSPIPSENVWSVDDVDVSKIDPKKKLVALTFDDGPKGTLERLLAIFAKFNEAYPNAPASATLFLNRFSADAIPTLRLALAMDMELGNHTLSHCDLTAVSTQKAEREIDEMDKLLCQLDGKARHLLRAPYGNVDSRLRSLAHTPILSWTIDTLDWTNPTPQHIITAVQTQVYDGAIVLMHDGYEDTLQAVKTLLPWLHEHGYQTVSVSQMIKAHNLAFERGNVYIRARPKREKL